MVATIEAVLGGVAASDEAKAAIGRWLEQQLCTTRLSERLRQAMVAIAQAPGVDQALAPLVAAAADLTGMEGGAVYLVEGPLLKLRHQAGLPQGLFDAATELPVDDPILQAILDTHEPTDPTPIGGTYAQLGRSLGIRCVRTMAIRSGQDVLGFITVASTVKDEPCEGGLAALGTLLLDTAAVLQRLGAEAAARHDRAVLRGVFDSIDDLVFVKDASGRFVDANRAFEEAVGVPLAVLVGATDQALFSADLAEMYRCNDALVLATGEPHRVDELLPTPEGRACGDTLKMPLRDEAGRVVGLVGVVRDITERKRQQDALQESESRFRSLFEHNHTVMLLVDPDSIAIVDANPAAVRYYGWSREELVGKHLTEIDTLPGDQLLVAADGARQARQRRFSYQHRLADGSIRDVEIHSSPVPVDHRTLLLSLVFDVTDRLRSEAALRESEQNYRTLADSGQALIWLADLDKRCCYFNRTWLDFTGRTLEQELGDGWADGVHPDDVSRCVATYVTAFEQRERFSMEYRLRRHDGEFRWIQDDGCPRFAASGEFAGYVGHCLDITVRKQAEDALRDSDARFRSLVESAPEAIFVQSQGRFVYCNPATLRLLEAAQPADLLGTNFMERMAPECRQTISERIRLQRETGDPAPLMEQAYLRLDGSRVPVETTAVAVRYEGSDAHLVFVRDITGRKRAEEENTTLQAQLQQTQKMESLGVLAGGIAHDFNNILMAVLGYAELALDEVPRESAARDDIVQIGTAARRAAELCRQMLAYSGKASFALEPLDLRLLIEEMAHLLKTSISKKVILNLRLDPNLPLIQADPSQIRQIVLNLLINASDAIASRSGVITVSVGVTRCDEDYLRATELCEELDAGTYLHLEVTDTGCGMDPETRARIFEPFFTTKFAGRGLGLAAVMGIVRAHRGALKVYSELGQGTTFKILLPALEAAVRTADDEDDSLAAWRGSGTVLLAEDEETVRKVGARLLERLGFTVLAVNDGQQAVDLYRERAAEIDLVVLDLTMPHMDGAEAFTQLRHFNPAVKVLLASGYSEEDVASRFAGRSLVGVLQKPFTLRRLRGVLRGVC